ncbi:aminotransferase class I/II-fold pyridoxal phosphate-dependent enzyme [Arthrobacter pigmenti]
MGEPDFDTPSVIVEALHEAVLDGATHYGDLNGDAELRQELATTNSTPVAPTVAENISITHGASAALAAVILAVADPGDRVVIPEPSYSLYQDLLQMIGAEPIFVPLTQDNQLDVSAIANAARDAVAIILCNPGNPTGAVLSAESLGHLGEELEGMQSTVISDEAYSGITYGDGFVSARDVGSLKGRTVVVQTFSKTYAMTGWRLGYTVASAPLASRISLIHRTLNGAVNSAVQRAGLTALRQADADVKRMLASYGERRDRVVELVDNIPGVTMTNPEGAFYAFIRYALDKPSQVVVAELAEAGVIVRAGDEYGPSGEGAFRVSFAASLSDIEEGFTRIRSYFERGHR